MAISYILSHVRKLAVGLQIGGIEAGDLVSSSLPPWQDFT